MRLRVSALVLALMAVGAVAWAQDPTGTIEGTVHDPTRAVIAGARVTARNLATNAMRETTAGADGFYRLVLLPVGQYSLIVESAQFATLVQEPVAVNVSQTVRVDAQLELRSVTETVTVAGQARLV